LSANAIRDVLDSADEDDWFRVVVVVAIVVVNVAVVVDAADAVAVVLNTGVGGGALGE